MRRRRRLCGSPRQAGPVAVVAVFLGWALLLGMWAIANPLMTGPDEPQHVINAVAVAHGDLGSGSRREPDGRQFVVTVPEYVTQEQFNACTAFRPDQTADCQRPRSARTVRSLAATQFNNYPPLYYLIVGSGTYVASGLSAFVIMRALSVAMCAACLTAASVFLIWTGWRRRAIIGLATAVSPMTLFLAGVINDSSLEITAAVAVWAGAIHLTTVESSRVRARSLFVVVCLVLAASRPPDLLFLPVIVGAAAFVTARAPGWWRALGLRSLWVPIIAGEVLAAVQLGVGGAPNLLGHAPARPLGFWSAVEASLDQLPMRAAEVIGVLGWLDTPLPAPVLTLWVVALGGLAVTAWRRSGRRALAVSVLLVVASIFGCTLVEARSYNTIGLFVQARYVLPLLAGIPMLLLTRGGPDRSLLLVVTTCLGFADVLAFQQELRRYGVGLSGPLFPQHTSWGPAVPWPGLAAGYLTVVLAAAVLVLRGRDPADAVGCAKDPEPQGP